MKNGWTTWMVRCGFFFNNWKQLVNANDQDSNALCCILVSILLMRSKHAWFFYSGWETTGCVEFWRENFCSSDLSAGKQSLARQLLKPGWLRPELDRFPSPVWPSGSQDHQVSVFPIVSHFFVFCLTLLQIPSRWECLKNSGFKNSECIWPPKESCHVRKKLKHWGS